MKHNYTPINIISASAGSGKTYNLVFRFLKRLLSKPNADVYRKMIGLTFTNKAVFEMKSRILKNLNDFSVIKDKSETSQMASDLCLELELSEKKLAYRSEKALKLILHDYAAFEIVTLDRFTHRIIRSFARDLGLSGSFEVEIQQNQILPEVVERVINKVGSNYEVTRLLELFTLQKFNDNLSWDISKNLIRIAELLLNENDRIPIQELLMQSRSSFDQQHKKLKAFSESIKHNISLIGSSVLMSIESKGLNKIDFSRGLLFNHFEKLKKLDFNRLYDNKLEENLALEQNIYNAYLDSSKASIIDSLLPAINSEFHKAKKQYHKLSLANDMLSQWIPLSLIKILANELELYQHENNKVLLATFNIRISKEILHQPAPYIYERLGEHYCYYFLDEFQDTSILQWSNLIPLIGQPLEGLGEDGTPGTLLIVGDPKQSIYRWRGGRVEQFLSLLNGENPFQVPSKVIPLKENYRSFETIVNFNNDFFKTLLPQINSTQNRDIFKNSFRQLIKNISIGYVEIDQFSEKNNYVALNIHVEKTHEAIQSSLEQGFDFNEIAVLVRTKAQAAKVSEFLVLQGVPFLSSESLSLNHSKEVQFLIALLQLALNEENLNEKLLILESLKINFEVEEPYHTFISRYLRKPIQDVFNSFEIEFNFSKFKALPLYEAVEVAFYSFKLSVTMDAHLQTFLDHVFEFSQQKNNDLLSFLMHWDQQGDLLYVASPRGLNAVQVLTIHKAKGLEFPVVILPFLDDSSQGSHKAKVWLDTKEFFGDSINTGWIPFSKRLDNYGTEGKALFDRVNQSNELDDLNVLYVAMTRPVEQLILISNLKPTSVKNANIRFSYANIIKNFLKINSIKELQIFVRGQKRPLVNKLNKLKEPEAFSIEINIKKWQRSLMIQSANQNESKINLSKVWGILIHDLLAKLETAEDLDWIIDEAYVLGRINQYNIYLVKEILTNILKHSALSSFYKNEYTVWNERDILIPNKENIRLDRLMKSDDKMIIIDYKTGKPKREDLNQIEHYQNTVIQMFNPKEIQSYLVYIHENNEIEVVSI